MSTITRYAVVDNPDEWGDAYQYDSLRDARDDASRTRRCIVAIEYEYSDSEYLGGDDDYRPVSKRRAEDIDALDRDALIALLEGVGIVCDDIEDDETLREAVRVSLDDGTIDENDIDAQE